MGRSPVGIGSLLLPVKIAASLSYPLIGTAFIFLLLHVLLSTTAKDTKRYKNYKS